MTGKQITVENMEGDVNILKPPNWAIRKQHLLERQRTEEAKELATNIGYHLGELSKCYKNTKKSVN